MTEWAVLVFFLSDEKDTGAGKGERVNKRSEHYGGTLARRTKLPTLMKILSTRGFLNSLLELPETQS